MRILAAAIVAFIVSVSVGYLIMTALPNVYGGILAGALAVIVGAGIGTFFGEMM